MSPRNHTNDALTAEHALAASTAPLVAAIGDTASFAARLAAFLRQRAASDSLVMLRYHYQYAPEVLFEALDARDAEALYDRYFEGTYLLSPFYLRWRAEPERHALYHLKDIVPEGFFDSVYYTDYYERSGLIDEVGYLVPVDADSAVLLSLGRTARLPAFATTEHAQLDAVEPIVSGAVQRHSALTGASGATRMRKQLADALQLFGSSLLTEREQGVVQLMLRGHSSKSCARALGISPTTERVHRRNIYAKLGISSQAELFSLFFEALAADRPTPGSDPLMRAPGHGR